MSTTVTPCSRTVLTRTLKGHKKQFDLGRGSRGGSKGGAMGSHFSFF